MAGSNPADDFIVSGYTDSTGSHSILWTPTKNDFDDVADAYAVFEEFSLHEKSVSQQVKVSTKLKSASNSLTLFASANTVYEGNMMTFSGRLTNGLDQGIAGALVTITEDDLIGDDFMASGLTVVREGSE